MDQSRASRVSATRYSSITSTLLDGGITTRQLSKRLSVNERQYSISSKLTEQRTTSFFGRKSEHKTKSSSDHSHSVTYETQLALDVLFGFSFTSRREPMEIELKDLRDPTLVYRNNYEDFTNFYPRLSNSVSIHSFDGRVSEASFEIVPIETNFSALSLEFWKAYFIRKMLSFVDFFRVYLTSQEDEKFYDALRIQPVASGAYLRGMLISGFSTLFFQTYSISFLRLNIFFQEELSYTQNIVKSFLIGWLLLQFFINIIQFPLRLRIHINFFQSSRSIDMERTINILRNTIQGSPWLLCRGLCWIQDILSILGLALIEVYMCTNVDPKDPLKPLMIALSSTHMLGFIIRIVISTIFSISMHDPQVLLEARRRGLSRLDLEVMPTFVFTNSEDVNNLDCSICLTSFDIGDMLISLPCHKRHSFHASCIRNWLTRQNSCPLCQKII